MQTQPGAAGETIVDARGHRCPTPTLRLRRALADAPRGSVVVLLADDPMARIDVPYFAAEAGHALIECSQEGAVLRFSVLKVASAAGGDRVGPPV